MIEILFYETKAGKAPVIDFLEILPPKEAQKAAWVLSLIQELPTISSKYFNKLVNTEDIWEIRIASGKNIYRILGFFDGERLIVLNHAFQKKTQKMPKQVIKIAEQRKKEYFKRGNVK